MHLLTIVGVASDISVRFGKRVRHRRRQLGWQQIELAEQAGISENYVSELELGRLNSAASHLPIESYLSISRRAS